MTRRKSEKLSPEKYKAYREAVKTKMERAGFSEEEISRFHAVADRVGSKDFLYFLFMIEKVAPLLPLEDDEVLESVQAVSKADAAKRCPTCDSKIHVYKQKDGSHHCYSCKGTW